MSEERGEQEEVREREVLHALIWLLRALNDNQAHGRADAKDSPLYDKVMQRAQEERFLVYEEDSATAQTLSSATGDLEPYTFTHDALEMLRWADALGI
jgi:hypothetical protein